ncbi:cytochrome P450 [Blyttiomyces helicus]|uniref:Cytochrome P450 n=1 Tax=Blyttiomyces helicus TaxID=388810 RepID=A0A4P9WL70_9FUNG|nr:cytochrome P450 [Blyttiomyces helicus]|eukprot:RKO93604.1 cytochrome P450 [Blyttiomyces helicus]
MLPPIGSYSLSVVGETLRLAAGPRAWSEAKIQQGTAAGSHALRTNILAQSAVFLYGREGLSAFYDPLNVKRHGAEIGKFRKLVLNDQEAVPTMDGPTHRTRKAFLLTAHTSEWIDGYLKESAEFQEKLVDLIKEAAAGAGALPGHPEDVWLGLEAGDEYVANVMARAAGMQAPLPIDFPGITYHAAIVARDALFATYADQLAKHRANPDAFKYSALSALLAKQQEYELSDLMILTELHHFVSTSSGLMAPVISAAIMGLATNPEALEWARAEADAHADLFPSVRMDDIGSQMPFLAWTIKEASRKYATLPIQLGLAARDFDFDGTPCPRARSSWPDSMQPTWTPRSGLHPKSSTRLGTSAARASVTSTMFRSVGGTRPKRIGATCPDELFLRSSVGEI